MKTAKGLLEHCRKALKNNVQYVYGAKMEVLSLKQIQNLRQRYGGMVWQSDLQKAGMLCCDCSGLISSYTGIERSSTNYKETALQTVSIAQLKADWKKYIGWGIWLNGHIGVVSDTEGYYYAMDGSARNMVHFSINRQPWLYAIKLKDIDYTEEKKEAAEVVETVNIVVNGKQIKTDAIIKDGETFLKLRSLENADFAIGYDKDTKLRTLDNLVKVLSVEVKGEDKGVESVNFHGYNFVNLRPLAAALDYTVAYNAETKAVALSPKE